jgi:hypothetical protein
MIPLYYNLQYRATQSCVKTRNTIHQAAIMRPWPLFFTEYSGKTIEAAPHKEGGIRTYSAVFKIQKKIGCTSCAVLGSSNRLKDMCITWSLLQHTNYSRLLGAFMEFKAVSSCHITQALPE